MACSVLGKRDRGSTEPSLLTSPSHHRVKRRAKAVTIFGNDENVDPVLSARKRAKPGQDVFVSYASEEVATPVKHSVAGERIALSPTKSNAHHKPTQSPRDTKRKTIQVVTPQTPRYRDALSKKVPITPRHRVTVVGKPLTPRTPRTPSTPTSSVPTVYNSARQLFVRSAHPGRLIGRDAERAELNGFLHERIVNKTGGCLYVSGPPGTGKSALVNEVCGELGKNELVRAAHINCITIRSSRDIFGKLIEDLSLDSDLHEEDGIKALQKMFAPRKRGTKIYIVTLDEIDHLLSLDLEIVYTLFEWSLQKASQLVLIGIANALDFTDRFLPRLKARHLKPHLLPFLPYAATQITSVISNRLRSVLPSDTSAPPDFVPFIHPAATQLCARKVASQTGDIRKAFDICRRAIELVELETTRKQQQQVDEQMASPPSPSRTPLTENTNLSSSPLTSSPGRSPFKTTKRRSLDERMHTLTPETAPRATIAHVARVTSAAFGNGVSQRLQTLNLQQKAALCALVGLEKKKRALSAVVTGLSTPSKTDRSAPTIRALYETYTALCRRDGMLQPLTSTEFRDVVGNLETMSLICAMDGKNSTFATTGTPSKRGRASGLGGSSGDDKRVGSCVGEKELSSAVEGVAGGVLLGLLQGDEP